MAASGRRAASTTESLGRVRYAAVGAGWISQEGLMPGVRHTGNSVATAAVTGNPEKAKVLGERYAIRRNYHYDQYDDLLESGEIDAIYLALPNTMHRNYATRALNMGAPQPLRMPAVPTRPTYDRAIQLELIETPEVVDAARPEER